MIHEAPFVTDEVYDVPLSRLGNQFMLAAFRIEHNGATTESLAIYRGLRLRSDADKVLVRIQSACITGEIFDSDRCDCRWQLEHALSLIIQRGRGVVIYLPAQEGRGYGIFKKVQTFAFLDKQSASIDRVDDSKIETDKRDYRGAFAVLNKFGVSSIALITNNPAKIQSAINFGFQVERVSSVMPADTDHIRQYFEMKRRAFGHLV